LACHGGLRFPRSGNPLRHSGREELEYTWAIKCTPDGSRWSSNDPACEFHDEFRNQFHYNNELHAELTVVEFDKHVTDS